MGKAIILLPMSHRYYTKIMGKLKLLSILDFKFKDIAYCVIMSFIILCSCLYLIAPLAVLQKNIEHKSKYSNAITIQVFEKDPKIIAKIIGSLERLDHISHIRKIDRNISNKIYSIITAKRGIEYTHLMPVELEEILSHISENIIINDNAELLRSVKHNIFNFMVLILSILAGIILFAIAFAKTYAVTTIAHIKASIMDVLKFNISYKSVYNKVLIKFVMQHAIITALVFILGGILTFALSKWVGPSNSYLDPIFPTTSALIGITTSILFIHISASFLAINKSIKQAIANVYNT